MFSHIRSEYGDLQSKSLYPVRMRENKDQKISEVEHFVRITFANGKSNDEKLFGKQLEKIELQLTWIYFCKIDTSQPAFTCSKLTIETLEQGVKYVQS